MSNNGTNNYNGQKLTPAEAIVSRTLQSRNRFWSNVIWRTGRPALDSEWNLHNDVNLEMLSTLIRSKTPSGWLDSGENRYPSGNSGTVNNLEFYSNKESTVLDIPNVVVNGWPLLIGGINYTDTSINSVTLNAAPISLGDQRYDFVFLEVFKAQVRSRDENNNPIAQNKPSLTEIYAYGNTQYGGSNFIDDLVDTTIQPSIDGIETSQRVQLQYRIRVVSDVNFSNIDSPGFDNTVVQGQGANPTPQTTGYQFTNMKTVLNDSGLWRAGNGDEASTTALRSVDGYTYAIPMFKIYRRTQVAYNDTGIDPATAYNNQQGNSTNLASSSSDRPDGKFYDGIDFTDITDLRLKASLGDLNFDTILEKNLDLLLRGDLESGYRRTLQYDSVADSDVNGYTDFRSNEGASGKREIWSDTATDQDDIFARITTGTTDNSLDVYVVKLANPNWVTGDKIIVQKTTKLPTGTIVKATPRIYIEEKNPIGTSVAGSWSGLNTAVATFTLSGGLGHNKNLWVYYDVSLPTGQGISYVPNEMNMIKYTNYGSILSGTVVRGEILYSLPNRFQDLFSHTYENKSDATTFIELELVSQRKQFALTPMIQTTTTRDGTTRSMDVMTTDKALKIVYVPYGLQHLKGIYTSASGGTELATQAILNTQVSSVDVSDDSILIDENFYIAELTSLKYDATGGFVGSEVELLASAGGLYYPVYTHKKSAPDPLGSLVKLYDASGNLYDILTGSTAVNFRWSGRRIDVRAGSGKGYDIDGLIVDCSGSDNNALFSGFVDGQQLWIDIDYLGSVHNGAEVRLIYEHTPYQGFNVGNQDLELLHKRHNGVFFNNGTGGGTVSTSDSSGTSNYLYTPMSSKLPGSFNDYLRDGAFVDIGSKGTKRYNSDAYFYSAYDFYGYFGGGSLFKDTDYTMPSSPETTSRGFLGNPMLEVIFELPTTDQTYAEFILVLLVKNKATNEVYLLVQIGNKGIQKQEEGTLYLEIYRLDEKLLLK